MITLRAIITVHENKLFTIGDILAEKDSIYKGQIDILYSGIYFVFWSERNTWECELLEYFEPIENT
jgi:hypothetical protein